MRALSKGETSHYEWRKWVQLLIERLLHCGIVTITHASIPILFPIRFWLACVQTSPISFVARVNKGNRRRLHAGKILACTLLYVSILTNEKSTR